jgi:hypothetical protein
MANEFLDRASHIVFMLTCVALVALGGIKVWDDHSARTALAPVGAQENPLPPGTKLAALDGVSYATSNVTVAIIVQSECRFCTASMPFYLKLAKMRAAKRLQLVAISRESVATTTNYLKAHGLQVDAAAMLTGSEIPTTGTPTLVLVNKSGVVERSWLGQLSSNQERDVVERIKSAIAGRV